MTDYTQVTTYTPKDSLLTGDPNKKILGSQLDGELSLIATAIASKLNSSVVSGAANPTGSVGLTAVNGSATTFTRSDGAPALSQAIVPTWTGAHTFTKTGSTTQIVLQTSDAGTDVKNTVFRSGASGGLQIVSSADATPTGGLTSLISSTRTGTAWPTLILGNAVDNTVVTFPGTGGATVSGAVRASDGSVSLPGLAFGSDTSTGLYRTGASEVRVACGGVDAGAITATKFSPIGVIAAPNGTVLLPSLTFASDLDTGVYRIGVNNLGIAAAGIKVLDISSGAVGITGGIIATTLSQFQAAVQVGDGTVSVPGLGFLSDPDTGIYRIGTNNVGLAANGTKVADITTATFNVTSTDLAVNGNNITPTYSSFTGTLTGMTGATTGTITYRKVGSIVTLYTSGAAILGTSNTTAMTLTGLPAALIPASNQSIPINVVDNGVNLLGSFLIDNAGAVSFKTFTVSGSSIQNVGVFTNSGSKGLPNGFSVTYGL